MWGVLLDRLAGLERGGCNAGLVCVSDDDVVAGRHRAGRGHRLRTGVVVRHAAAEPGRVDVAGARCRADDTHRARSWRPGSEPAPSDDERRCHGDPGGDGAGTCRGVVRHRVHRSPGDGIPGDPVVVHAAYIEAYCGLLRGEIVEWEGARMQMLHPDGSGAARPIDVPVLVGALGPKGRAVAERPRRRLRDDDARRPRPGRVRVGRVPRTGARCSTRASRSTASGSSPLPGPVVRWPTTPRTSSTAVTPSPTLPGGNEWLAKVDERREDERHLDVHVGHCIQPERGRSGSLGGDGRLAVAVDHGDRHRRRGEGPHRPARRARCHRGRVPALRVRHQTRARNDVCRRRRVTSPSRRLGQADPPSFRRVISVRAPRPVRCRSAGSSSRLRSRGPR